MKARRWYIYFPGNVYAYGPVEFDARVSERTVRAWAREWARLRRLPPGFGCWPM